MRIRTIPSAEKTWEKFGRFLHFMNENSLKASAEAAESAWNQAAAKGGFPCRNLQMTEKRWM